MSNEFKEVELTEEELNELNAPDSEDIPEDNGEEDNNSADVTEVKKPGKIRKFGKAVLRGVKWVLPKVGMFAAGYATKLAITKFTGKPAIVDGTATEVPQIPVTSETIDLGDGVKAEVQNF